MDRNLGTSVFASISKLACGRWAALLITAIFALYGCTWVIDKASNKVYANLARPFESEAPATFVAFPSSIETEAIIGGQGRGLDCSIPWYGDLAFRQSDGVSDIRLRFRQACVNHDFCYRHGLATYGYTQNDCDMAIQESAYRLCRQIQRDRDSDSRATADPYSYCETEAKKVLLGVALGGAGSYKGAGRSTYFEYDPMPAHADDFLVARALAMDTSTSDPSDLGFRAFLFKRNSVMMVGQREGSSPEHSLSLIGSDKMIPFPTGRMATPPHILPASSPAPFAALARAGFTDTSLEIELFHPKAGKGASELEFESRRDVMTCKGENEKWADCDVSVYKFAQKGFASEVVSLVHRGSLASGTGPKVLEHRLDRNSEPSYVTHGLDTQDVHNAYRFLAHDVLIERDAKGNATHALVLARGVGADPSGHYQTDNAGSNFSKQVLVTRQGLGDGPEGATQRFILDASERNEPLSLVRVSRDGASALIGVDWREEDTDRRNMTPSLKAWLIGSNTIPGTGTAIPLAPEMRNRYMEIPPIIARFPQMDDARMFFPRFTNTKERTNQIDASSDDISEGAIQFDVLLARLHLDSTHKLNANAWIGVKCDIDLNAQIESQKAVKIRNRAARSYPGASEKNSDLPRAAKIAAMLDLNHRWRMSQVIASQRKSNSGEQEVALTIVFNGFTAMSFQLLFHVDPNQDLVFDRAAGGENFVHSCGLSSTKEAARAVATKKP